VKNVAFQIVGGWKTSISRLVCMNYYTPLIPDLIFYIIPVELESAKCCLFRTDHVLAVEIDCITTSIKIKFSMVNAP